MIYIFAVAIIAERGEDEFAPVNPRESGEQVSGKLWPDRSEDVGKRCQRISAELPDSFGIDSRSVPIVCDNESGEDKCLVLSCESPCTCMGRRSGAHPFVRCLLDDPGRKAAKNVPQSLSFPQYVQGRSTEHSACPSEGCEIPVFAAQLAEGVVLQVPQSDVGRTG
jgi:hypothetical protein